MFPSVYMIAVQFSPLTIGEVIAVRVIEVSSVIIILKIVCAYTTDPNLWNIDRPWRYTQQNKPVYSSYW